MRKKKPKLVKLVRETPAEHRSRVSSGIKIRATAFQDKRRKLLEKVEEIQQ